MELYYSPGCVGCKSVRCIIRALGVKVKETLLDMRKQQHKGEEYTRLNPCQIVPTLVDDDFVLWESRAISCYLVDKYGADDSLYPRQPEGRAEVDRLLYFDATVVYPSISKWLYPQVLPSWPHPRGPLDQVKRALSQLDAIFLSEESPYFSGNHVTIADFSLLVSVTLLEAVEYNMSAWPNVTAWIASLRGEFPFVDECIMPGIHQMRSMREAVKCDKL